MGLVLKMPQLCLLLFFCSWLVLSQGNEAPSASVKIDPKTIEDTAKVSMTESNILDEMAEAATKNQGGAKAIKGIKGLKVKDIRPPNMTVTCIENVGLGMNVTSQITIAGKSFIGGTMEITVRSSMNTKTKMEVISPTDMKYEVMECSVELLSCKTNLPSSMLPKIVNKFLNSTLGKVLPGMMCPAADKVVNVMKERMVALFKPCSCGYGVTMQYTLKTNLEKKSTYLGINFDTRIEKNGERIELPMDPPATTDLPAKREGTTVVYIPVNVLNAATGALEEAFNGEVAGGMKAKVTANPVYNLEEGKGTMTAPVQIEVPAEGIVVRMDLKMDVSFEVQEEKLKTVFETVSMENVENVSGNSDDSKLNEMANAVKSSWNDKLPSICLPSLLGGSYGHAPADIHQNILALHV